MVLNHSLSWYQVHISCVSFFIAGIMRYYDFADLQLDVKGCRDVYASFDKYVEVERLEGDNKYHAENHGLQVYTPHTLVTIKL
jgi:hypothetical protein